LNAVLFFFFFFVFCCFTARYSAFDRKNLMADRQPTWRVEHLVTPGPPVSPESRPDRTMGRSRVPIRGRTAPHPERLRQNPSRTADTRLSTLGAHLSLGVPDLDGKTRTGRLPERPLSPPQKRVVGIRELRRGASWIGRSSWIGGQNESVMNWQGDAPKHAMLGAAGANFLAILAGTAAKFFHGPVCRNQAATRHRGSPTRSAVGA